MATKKHSKLQNNVRIRLLGNIEHTVDFISYHHDVNISVLV